MTEAVTVVNLTGLKTVVRGMSQDEGLEAGEWKPIVLSSCDSIYSQVVYHYEWLEKQARDAFRDSPTGMVLVSWYHSQPHS